MFFRHDDKREIEKRGVLNALGALGYIILVVSLMFSIKDFGGPDGASMLQPVGFLSLLSLSAAVMASLVFGKPAMLYVDGKKKEALKMLGWTIGTFAVLTFALFLLIASVHA